MISDKALALLTHFEGCILTAYDDKFPKVKVTKDTILKGTLTIGYGHTGTDVHKGQTITESEARVFLRVDLDSHYLGMLSGIGYSVEKSTQDQLDAMALLTYNIGIAAFSTSAVCRFHKQGAYAKAADSFRNFRRSNGVIVAGLLRRRYSEAHLYLTGECDTMEATSNGSQPWQIEYRMLTGGK